MSATSLNRLFNTSLKRKRVVGFTILAVLLFLFIWFNRIPKLDIVGEDLIAASAAGAECFQGLCIDGNPETSLLSRWWLFSLTYLKLVTLGMIFAFLVAGLTEVFLFPPEALSTWTQRGIRGSLRGLIIGSAMNLCSACIVPVSSAFRRRGAGIETTLAIVQGSSTMNLPALIMAAMVFTPMLAGTRIGLSVVGALILGPIVAALVGRSEKDPPVTVPMVVLPESAPESWRLILIEGLPAWLWTSIKYLFRLGPLMVVAGLASGMAIQWVSPETVDKFLGNNVLGVATAATFGILINVPLLFEIPLVAALLLVGMGTVPAATLLFVAAAGGPITFWGLAKVMSKRTVVTFATATWSLGAVAGLGILSVGLIFGDEGPQTIRIADNSTTSCPICLLRDAIGEAEHGDTIEIPPGIYTLRIAELVLNKDLTLAGAGADQTVIQAAESLGTANSRVLRIPIGRTVTISGITIRYGVADSTAERHVVFPATVGGIVTTNYEFGGGIHIHGTLTLIDSVVNDNSAGGGGGIFNGGTLIMKNSRIGNNQADGQGGGIFNGGILELEGGAFQNNRSQGGGAISNWGNIEAVRTSISDNRARVAGGGILNTAVGNLNMDSVTVNNNSAGSGGGIRNFGQFTLSNSTVSLNSASAGGGIDNWKNMHIANSTLTSNESQKGGGINVRWGHITPPETELTGTILAGNSANEGADCHGPISSTGNNLLGIVTDCDYRAGPSDLMGTSASPLNPLLGPLQNNGGPTETHSLMVNSPAINAGERKSELLLDQRGAQRAQTGVTDIGSFERQ